MSIVTCHDCRKRYSSVKRSCPHCGADPDDAPRRRKADGAGVNTHYLLGMLTAIGGTGWYYSAYSTGQDVTYAKWMIGAGLVWYAAARIRAALRRR